MKCTLIITMIIALFGCSANPIIKPIPTGGVSKEFLKEDVAIVWGQTNELGEIYIKGVNGKTVWQQFMNGHARSVALSEGTHTLEVLYMYDEPASYLSYEEKMEVIVKKGNVYVINFARQEKNVDLSLDNLGSNASCEMLYMGQSLYKKGKLTCKE